MSDKFPGSISDAALRVFKWRHIYVTPPTHPLEMLSEPHPDPWRDAAANIIALLNLIDVAAKLRGAEALAKSANAQLKNYINAIASTPDPEAPVTPPQGGVPVIGGLGWHWPGPIPPGPLAVILELNLYSKKLADEKFVAKISEVITTIGEKAKASTAQP
jgi:hypothetical protein